MYDSKAESTAALMFEALGYRRPSQYEFINAELVDLSGSPFKAMFDFIPADPLDCSIEFKTSGLNTKRTKADADRALHAAKTSTYRTAGQTDRWLEQKYSWSNSAHKHSEQQRKLPPLSHFIVFSEWPTFEEIKVYCTLGILWCHLSDFAKFNSYCRAARLGLPLIYNNITPDGQCISFPLSDILQWHINKTCWQYVRSKKCEWESAGFKSTKQRLTDKSQTSVN